MERNTRQRAAIREALTHAGRPLLPQEVLGAAQQAIPGLGIATVYRMLKTMLDGREIQPVTLPGENVRYEIVGRQHHHHFQCRHCQRVYDVDACPGDLSRLAPAGFVVEDHELTLYGRCRHCADEAVAARRR